MAWGSLADVATGDIIAAARENQHIDNEEYLYANSKLLIAETIVAAACQNINFASLTAYEQFDLEVALNWNYAGLEAVFLYFNGDYTKTNYWTSWMQNDHTTLAGQRDNNPGFGVGSTSERGFITAQIMNTKSAAATYDHPFWHSKTTLLAGSGIIQRVLQGNWTTAAQISSIRFGTDRATGIGIGSRFRLWGK